MNTLQKLGIKTQASSLVGKRVDMDEVFDNNIIIHKYEVRDSKYPRKPGEKCMWLQIEMEGTMKVCFTTSVVLMNTLKLVEEASFPILTRIIKNKSSRSFEFAEPINNN